MTKKQLLEKLQSSEELIKIAYVPVAEVINWVNELEDNATLNQDQISELVDTITDELNNQGLDLVNDYDLEMNYRVVEISSIEFDDTRISRAVKEALNSCDLIGEKEGD